MAPVTLRRVASIYVPLALSWLLMAAESPVSVSILSRRADATVQTAAFLLLMSFSLWIESPVIDLLTTSTTLATDAARVATVQRFALQMMAWCTVVHATFALTPVFGWVMSAMAIPDSVAAALHVPMIIMIPWSACIGWRRWRQGIMIRQQVTRPITIGTSLRLATIATVGWGLAMATSLPGTVVAAIALASSVFVESAFVHGASKIALEMTRQAEPAAEALDGRTLRRFHFPLTAATMTLLSTGAVISAALARTPHSVLQMAGWQVCSSLAWGFRTITFALPEMIISLVRDRESARLLRRFSLTIGASLFALQSLIAIAGIDEWFFRTVIGADRATAHVAHLAFSVLVAMPILSAISNYGRARLTAASLTLVRLWGIAAGMITLLVALDLLVRGGAPGFLVAGGASLASQIAEASVISISWLKSAARTEFLHAQ